MFIFEFPFIGPWLFLRGGLSPCHLDFPLELLDGDMVILGLLVDGCELVDVVVDFNLILMNLLLGVVILLF